MPIPLLLHGKHADGPVAYQPFGDWIVPWRFQAFEEEYRLLRTAAGLIDYSTQALIECRGPDRISFLQRLLTNDIAALSPGQGCRAALLTDTAKLVGELLVLADADAHWLLCDLRRAAPITSTLERYLFSEQVTVVNHERRLAGLALQGPRTVATLARLAGAVISLPRPEDHAVARFLDLPVRVIRHTLTGDPGALCLVPAEGLERLWRWLIERGAESGVRSVGWEAFTTARIEAGVPWFGIDLDETNLLPETGLEAVAVSQTKGCYVGQEIVARMQTYGSPNKKLMGLLIEGKRVPEGGDPIRQGDQAVGRVTSGCFSPALARPIAMGYLTRGWYEPGTVVEILRGEARLPATVAARPFL